ncbi:MAG: hypothetical protein UH542_08820 [Bacteroidales bacterium]|nr:hypothetical protein [Bacteroidales bacterium]
MLIEELRPVADAITESEMTFTEMSPNEGGENERIAMTIRDSEDKGFLTDVNVMFDSDLGRYQYIGAKNNTVYPKEFIDEIVKIVTSINNAVKYGHFILSASLLGLHLTYRCDSPGKFISNEEFIENINYCCFMVKYYSKELEQFEQKIF